MGMKWLINNNIEQELSLLLDDKGRTLVRLRKLNSLVPITDELLVDLSNAPIDKDCG